MSFIDIRPDFVPNYRFIVTIGILKISFAKVTGLENSIEFDTIPEGGVNDRVHTFTKPRTQHHTIVFEKGTANISADKLAASMINFKAGSRIKSPFTIMILNEHNLFSRILCFDEGTILKWEATNLDALGNEIIIDRFEVAHSGLWEMPVPSF